LRGSHSGSPQATENVERLAKIEHPLSQLDKAGVVVGISRNRVAALQYRIEEFHPYLKADEHSSFPP
jgi:hypothetical protein